MNNVVNNLEPEILNAFPVPVVRLIITDKAGKVLLLKRQNTDYANGSWCLPGGKVEYGQTIVQAISKELIEETSLTCSEPRFLFYQDSLPTQPGEMHCINFYFQCDVSGKIILNDESSDFAWVKEEDFGKYDVAFKNDLALKRYWQELV